jgi:hypothetical protein
MEAIMEVAPVLRIRAELSATWMPLREEAT